MPVSVLFHPAEAIAFGLTAIGQPGFGRTSVEQQGTIFLADNLQAVAASFVQKQTFTVRQIRCQRQSKALIGARADEVDQGTAGDRLQALWRGHPELGIGGIHIQTPQSPNICIRFVQVLPERDAGSLFWGQCAQSSDGVCVQGTDKFDVG